MYRGWSYPVDWNKSGVWSLLDDTGAQQPHASRGASKSGVGYGLWHPIVENKPC